MPHVLKLINFIQLPFPLLPKKTLEVRLLKKSLESRLDSEWFFLDSPLEWFPVPGATDPIFGDVTDFEKALAKGQVLRTWYSHGNACYHGVDEGVEHL